MALISVQDLTFGYDGSPELLFEHASFQIDSSWRLGFVGRNGRGKTTLLNLLLGKYEYRGRILAPMPFDYFPFPVEDPGMTGEEIAESLKLHVCVCQKPKLYKIKRQVKQGLPCWSSG